MTRFDVNMPALGVDEFLTDPCNLGPKPAIERALRNIAFSEQPASSISMTDFQILLTHAIDQYHATPHAGLHAHPDILSAWVRSVAKKSAEGSGTSAED